MCRVLPSARLSGAAVQADAITRRRLAARPGSMTSLLDITRPCRVIVWQYGRSVILDQARTRMCDARPRWRRRVCINPLQGGCRNRTCAR